MARQGGDVDAHTALILLGEAASVRGIAATAVVWQCTSCGLRLGDPSRVAACGAHAAAVVHGVALLSM